MKVRALWYFKRGCEFWHTPLVTCGEDCEKYWSELLLFTLPCSQALVKPIKKENMKEESTPYARCEPAQTISVLLYSFNLPDFDYKHSVVCTRTQVHSWPWRVRRKGCRPLFSQYDGRQIKEISLKCQRNHDFFCGFLCFYAKLSSPHPASSAF